MYIAVMILVIFTIFCGAILNAMASHGSNEQAQLSVFSAFVIVFILAAIAGLVLLMG